MRTQLMLAAAALLLTGSAAHAAAATGEPRFRALYKELVETNTTLSSGDCTLAAERMAAHLRSAGFPDSALHLFTAPDHPKEGGLVAVFPGRDPKAKAILLLAHIDTVEAKREDWTRDPFTLVEENGNFYARGAADDKAEASIWVDLLVRLSEEKKRPRHTLKLALTCGEEPVGAFNGAQWLTNNKRELIDAAFAINEGAWGELDAAGPQVLLQVQAGEKTPQNYRLEVTNPGGHSSRPVKDNAIYRLGRRSDAGLELRFPTGIQRREPRVFQRHGPAPGGQGRERDCRGDDSLVQNPGDEKAITLVSAQGSELERDDAHDLRGDHARGRACDQCAAAAGARRSSIAASSRALEIEAVRAHLEDIVADPAVKVTTMEIRGPASTPPPLTPAIIDPVKKLAASIWPGVPVVPMLQPGATDGQFLNAAGIPTYGIDGTFSGPDLGNVHGLNEYLNVDH